MACVSYHGLIVVIQTVFGISGVIVTPIELDVISAFDKGEKVKKNWKEKVKPFLKGWGYPILVAILVATSFKSAIADWNIVPTGSMKPTIVEGDRIFVNKLAYDLKIPYTTRHIAQWGDPKRGEIVVFYSPADRKRLVKRVVGLPGDTIAMSDNILFINGTPQTYEPIDNSFKPNISDRYSIIESLNGRRHPVRMDPDAIALPSFGPVIVPTGSYFMMGDNRNNSADSRYFGFVKRSQIVGRATAVVASFDQSHHYRPRWERFFTALP